MNKPASYNGTEPFIFVSYAHKDCDVVWPIITKMREDGYRVWYDDGIEPGTEWDEFIAGKISDSSFFVAFISENYLDSGNCKDELNFARDKVDNKLLVYISEVILPQGMEMRLGRIQAIEAFKLIDSDSLYEKLYVARGIGVTNDSYDAEFQPRRVDDVPLSLRANLSKKWHYPDTVWGRWGIPGFRTNKLSHKVGAVILYILSIGLVAYLIDDYSFYIDKYNGKMRAFACLWIAVIYFIMLVFSTNYGWVQDKLFKTYKKPASVRAGIIIAFDLMMIALIVVVLFLSGIIG